MTAGPLALRPRLEMTDVEFRYRAGRRSIAVLDGVTLQVRAGESVAVMGASGSGKSTLLLCAAGLVRARRGSVMLDDVDVVTASEKTLARMRRGRIGFVFQDCNLVSALTVEQNVALPARFSGQRRPPKDVHAVLERVGLAQKAGSHPDELSGGQRQRVAIARALVSRPTVVFADEPTGSLDVRSGGLVLDALQELVDDGAALLMVTHDRLVAARTDRTVVLRDGELFEQPTSLVTPT